MPRSFEIHRLRFMKSKLESKTASQGDPKDPKFHGQIDDKTKAKMVNKLKGFSTK